MCNFNTIHPNKLISFLKVLKGVISNIGRRLNVFLPALNEIIIMLTDWAFKMSTIVKEDTKTIRSNRYQNQELNNHDKSLLRISKLTKTIKHLV